MTSLKNQGIQYFRQQLEIALKEFIPIIEPRSVSNFEELFNNIDGDCEDEKSIDIEDNDAEENSSNEESCSDEEDT